MEKEGMVTRMFQSSWWIAKNYGLSRCLFGRPGRLSLDHRAGILPVSQSDRDLLAQADARKVDAESMPVDHRTRPQLDRNVLKTAESVGVQ